MNTYVNAKLKVLESALNILGGHVYWKNKQGEFVWCNKKLSEILELKDQGEIENKTDYDLYDKQLAEKVVELDNKVLATGKEYEIEESGLDINGKPAIYLSIKTPIKNELGNTDGLVGISIDITERKKAEEALKLAKEKAEVANQAKTEFLENMRHDIRTPLSGIVGCAHLIQMQSGLPKKVTAFADDLVQSSEALLEFLNKILESITVSSGEIPMLKKRFNLKEDLEQIVRLNKPQAVLKGLELSLDYDEKIPPYLLGDGVRAQRIVLELLTNALKYTDKGSIKVGARLIKNKEREAIVELRISDTGMGIPKDKHKEIYDRFTRLIPSYKGIYPGTGLGLSVVKQFIEDLGGKIQIESELDKGATFICVIPFQKSLFIDKTPAEASNEKSVLSKKRAANESLTVDVVNANGNHVLVVEDNTIAVIVAQNVLEELGCRTDVASDGKTALEKIEKNHYDLILMDMGLPDDDGCEVTRRIRLKQWQKNPSVPIIGLTAHAENEQKQRCLANGMNAVFNKPLTPEKAAEILDAFISHQQSQKAIPKSTDSLQASAILNVERAVELIGNKEVVKDCLELLSSGLNKELEVIKQHHEKGDWTGINNLAHKWKGGAGYCGASRLEQACEQLVAALRTKSLKEAEVCYQQLIQVAEQTKEAAMKAIVG